MKNGNAQLYWSMTATSEALILSFKITAPDGLLDAARLKETTLPSEMGGRERLGLIFSGRGPVWLYAHLTHLAHSFAWVAVHDPRLGGAVVAARHRRDAPQLGQIIPLDTQNSGDSQ